MAQVFDRSSNALARASLVLTGLIVIALGVTLDQLQPGTPVPVLSHLGGEVELCRHSSDEDLHQLPRADLDERRAAQASSRELGDRGVD